MTRRYCLPAAGVMGGEGILALGAGDSRTLYAQSRAGSRFGVRTCPPPPAGAGGARHCTTFLIGRRRCIIRQDACPR
jgi:hypothetical protein